tara:strand:- start:33137 stop:33364 length:228 start_codon:yes stop_codon:yes gene_type:complete
MKTDIVKDHKDLVKNVMENARDQIAKTDWYGPFGHNVIGLTLKSVADKIGTKYANQLIEEYDFTEELNIYPVEEK